MSKSNLARKPVSTPATQEKPVKAKRTRADNYAPGVPAGTIQVLVASNPKRANKKSAPGSTCTATACPWPNIRPFMWKKALPKAWPTPTAAGTWRMGLYASTSKPPH